MEAIAARRGRKPAPVAADMLPRAACRVGRRVNVRMKDALDKSKDRGCMSMICIILILAIVGYIYKMVA